MNALPNANPRVLVVDDNRVFADTMAVVLKQHGFDTDAAYSGSQAIRCALTVIPDFIVMDVLMDEIDGVDAAIAICETLPRIRILLISGAPDASKRLVKGSRRGHAFELLMKPIETSLLVNKMRGAENVRPIAA